MAEIDRQTIISFPNDALPDIESGIEAGSLNVSEILLSNGLNFGECNSNKFEATVYDIQDITGKKIYVYQKVTEGMTITEVPIFTGYVQSCKLDKYHYYRQIVAYDILSMYTADLAAWWNGFWEGVTSSTIYDLRTSLCEYIGIECDDEELFNDDFAITETMPINSLKLQDILKHIGQLTLTNPNITRDGKLQFVKLYDTETIDIDDDYEGGNSEFEDSPTRTITQVRVVNSKTNIYADSGAYAIRYTVADNIFLYDREGDALQAIADAMYAVIHALPTYYPASISMIVSNMDIHVGDFVEANDRLCLVCENTMSGSLLVEQDLVSKANTTEQQDNQSTDLVEQKKQEQLAQIDGASTQYYIITNPKSIKIRSNNRKKLITQRYKTTKEQAVAVFHADVIYKITKDEQEEGEEEPVTIKFEYVIDDTTIGTFQPKETFGVDGWHTIHLMYAWNAQPNIDDTFMVYVTAENCEMQVDAYNVNGYICGRSLIADLRWDGIIEIDEELPLLDMPTIPMSLAAMTGQVAAMTMQLPAKYTVTQTIGLLGLGTTMQMVGIDEICGFGIPVRDNTWNYYYVEAISWETLYNEYIW